MSDQSTPGEGFGPTPEVIEDMLREVREALGMDVAFVSEFAGDELVFRALEGDAESFGWREGGSFALDESYCKRVLEGRVPRVVPNAKREEATKDLRVTSDADMGSYCAVALVPYDGRLYGTLCCVSHEPDPWLRGRDLALMERTADLLVKLLERVDEALRSLGELATRDHLTGLLNRRAGEKRLAQDLARAERGGGTPSLAVVDLDGLKPINDEHGHRAGDACLERFASLLARNVRGGDWVARWGATSSWWARGSRPGKRRRPSGRWHASPRSWAPRRWCCRAAGRLA